MYLHSVYVCTVLCMDVIVSTAHAQFKKQSKMPSWLTPACGRVASGDPA